MIGSIEPETKTCRNCFRGEAVPGKFIYDIPACNNCWQRDRAAAMRRGKLRPGVCATVSTSLPNVKHVASLPGQLDLFGEGE
jgi:hypothetical protein